MGIYLGQDDTEENDGQQKEDFGRQVAIDGKTISKGMNERGKYESERLPYPRTEAQANGKTTFGQCISCGPMPVFRQEKVDSKENEIIAIPKLLDSLELHEGDIITIDAIGTQKSFRKSLKNRRIICLK